MIPFYVLAIVLIASPASVLGDRCPLDNQPVSLVGGRASWDDAGRSR